ncbi:polysaccharide deacetylase family protein [Streptacidiphilus carbonis]|jgi:peptidoglycan-N-acetylglucosamine deacetylase|uniref:polysaccharide deacetylase family protein n=1 Tax=Streptacidiphilus carbonis TaxID=105422 RepID=UPI0005AADCE6|nr:polysaccharide deacetylase family protein [Streptacidiphilus carbonis]
MSRMRIALAGAVAAAVAATLAGCGSGTAVRAAGSGASGSASPSASATGKSTSGDNVPPGGTKPVNPLIEYTTGSRGRVVALTFDDGPSPVWTPRILALLAQYHAHATFCEIGPNAKAAPAMVKAIEAAGDRLCDHSVSHNEAMSKWSEQRQTYEIAGAKKMIEDAGGAGTQVDWFRAPGGDFSPLNRHISVQNGLRPLGWTVDSQDWMRPGVPKILSNIHKELVPGAIILMHDGGGDRSQTMAALQQLLPELVSKGYSFEFPVK